MAFGHLLRVTSGHGIVQAGMAVEFAHGALDTAEYREREGGGVEQGNGREGERVEMRGQRGKGEIEGRGPGGRVRAVQRGGLLECAGRDNCKMEQQHSPKHREQPANYTDLTLSVLPISSHLRLTCTMSQESPTAR